MFSTTDTIVAIATPPGRGGIGVVRVSGPAAHAIARELATHADSFEPRRATFTRIRATSHAAKESEAIDHAVVTFFPSPASYTGDDVVEIAAHGSPVVLRSIVAAAIDCGARLAQPGEFTLRAFLNGRIDLMQAEAVADLIDSATPLQARAAFDQLEGTLTRAIGDIDAVLFDLIARLEASVDFPDEGYHFVEPGALADAIDSLRAKTSSLLTDARRGRLIRDGLVVAIVGRPNVGKSSLFNALVGTSRAIVAETPGTTRDFVTEAIDLDGLRVTLVDTAGLRGTDDEIEAEGVARSRRSAAVADFVLQVIVDDEPQTIDNKQLIVRNKSDLRPVIRPGTGVGAAAAGTGIGAAVTGTGIGAAVAGTGIGAAVAGTGVGAAVAGTGVGAAVAGTGIGAAVAGTGVGAAVAGTGVGAAVAGTGVGAAVAGTGVGAAVAGTGVGAAVAGTGVGAAVAGTGIGAAVAGTGVGAAVAGTGVGTAVAGTGVGGAEAGTGVGGAVAGTGIGAAVAGTGVGAAVTGTSVVSVSAKTGAGLDELRRAIIASLDADAPGRDRPEITNVRHIALVQRAHDALSRAQTAALAEGGSLSEEFVLADLQDARAALEEITGRRAPEELLEHIFSRFCIGK